MDAKALLDSLMGPERDKAKKDQKTDAWKERDVCKRFLVGFCPNDQHDNWFHNTKRDIGICCKLHSERLRQDFESHPDRKKYEAGYQQDFLRFLEGLNAEADACVAREKGKCAAPGKMAKLTEDQKETVANLQKQADEKMKEAEDLADKGQIVASKLAVERSKHLQAEVKNIKETNSFIARGDTVCTVCGVRYNLDDIAFANDVAHLNSNLHKAYEKTRQKAKELREKLRNHPVERSRNDDGEKNKDEKDDAKKDRRNDRDRDRSKDKDRPRDRRDRDRRDRRSRSRDRRSRDRRSRSRDRKRR